MSAHREYVCGERNGHGKFTYATGGSYEGNFINNKQQGQGTYDYGNGAQYTGQWENDIRSGSGKQTLLIPYVCHHCKRY